MADRMPSGDGLRRTFGHDTASVLPASWSEVDDPVSGGDDVEVVFDDDNRVPRGDEPVDDGQQAVDVGVSSSRSIRCASARFRRAQVLLPTPRTPSRKKLRLGTLDSRG